MVVERLIRVDAETVSHEVAIDDSTTCTRSWGREERATKGPD